VHTFEEIKNEIASYREALAVLNEAKRRTYEQARDLYKDAALQMGIDLGDPTDEQLDALHDAIGWGEFEDEYDAVLSTEPVGRSSKRWRPGSKRSCSLTTPPDGCRSAVRRRSPASRTARSTSTPPPTGARRTSSVVSGTSTRRGLRARPHNDRRETSERDRTTHRSKRPTRRCDRRPEPDRFRPARQDRGA